MCTHQLYVQKRISALQWQSFGHHFPTHDSEIKTLYSHLLHIALTFSCFILGCIFFFSLRFSLSSIFRCFSGSYKELTSVHNFPSRFISKVLQILPETHDVNFRCGIYHTQFFFIAIQNTAHLKILAITVNRKCGHLRVLQYFWRPFGPSQKFWRPFQAFLKAV